MIKKIVLFILVCLLCESVFAAKYVSADGSFGVSANRLTMENTSIKASGKVVYFSKTDGNNARVSCDSVKIVLTDSGKIAVSGDKNVPKDLASVKEAVFTGHVNFKYATDKENKISFSGTSDSAYYDGATQLLTMKGNVKLEYADKNAKDPSQMTGVATGEKAVINLKETIADGETIISIEGDDEKNTEIEKEDKRAEIEIDPKMFNDKE